MPVADRALSNAKARQPDNQAGADRAECIADPAAAVGWFRKLQRDKEVNPDSRNGQTRGDERPTESLVAQETLVRPLSNSA